MNLQTVIGDLPKEECVALLIRNIRYARDVSLAQLPTLERIKEALVERLLSLGETRESIASVIAAAIPVRLQKTVTPVLTGGNGRYQENMQRPALLRVA